MSIEPALKRPPNAALAPELTVLAATSAVAPSSDPSLLLSRETSILEFNRRVLAQALRPDVPLLERLRYICIVSSNIDEFFEVRFADYLEASRLPNAGVSDQDVQVITAEAHRLIDEQYAAFNDEVMPLLQREGIVILNHADRDEAQREWVDQFFQKQVRPLLVPIGLDPSHPFPLVANKALNFIVRLGGKDAFGRENTIAIVKVPRVLPRVIRLPDRLVPGRQGFVLLTSVMRAHLGELFPGREVEAFSQFRVTRDSDLEVDEDDVKNLRQALRSGLSSRHFGQAIRLEVVNTCPPELSEFLLHQFDLPQPALYKVNGPVNLVRLNQLIDQIGDRPGAALRAARRHLARASPAAQPVDLRAPAPRRRAAAPSVRVVRSGRAVPARGGQRPGGAGDQADDLPHRQRVAADGPADRRRPAWQGSDGGR